MEIITWCDPKYFKFMNALIRSIRYHENENLIIANLLDFTDNQYNFVTEIFKDSKLKFIRTSINNDLNYSVLDKTEFFRNFRPRFFKNVLENSPSGKITTFGANGLVFSKLDYIENLLDDNDFCFLEREKPNQFSNDPKTIRSIKELEKLIDDYGLKIDDVLESSTGKIVLLGTHAMRRNKHVIGAIDLWTEYIETSSKINKKFSDMNLFIKTIINYQKNNNMSFSLDTNFDIPRDRNYYCDTNFHDNSKIWFAKGDSKNTNKKYLEKLDFFTRFSYTL